MIKKAIMVIAIPLIVIAFVSIVGISSAFLNKKDDGPIEEAAEAIIEAQSQALTGVPLNFDLTPDSKELGDIAVMKIREIWCKEHCECVCKKEDG